MTHIKPIGDTDGNPIRPEWIPKSKILAREITVRDNHKGLWPILEKAVSPCWVRHPCFLLKASAKGYFLKGLIFTGSADKGRCLLEVLA
ncbi:MAG: hypothetical protein K2X08_06165 [Chlamydiales bacterium]|nr:hypothetical protein [Chlamydiales bacterium]